MSHKHLQLLRSIFHDPISGNIQWREVESLLRHVGAEIEPAHGGRFRVVLNRKEHFLSHPHHNSACSRDFIKHLREVLASSGVTVSSYESAKSE